MTTVRVLLVAEIEILNALDLGISEDRYDKERVAQDALDVFRDASEPNKYGIGLYRAPQNINREDYL